MASRNELKELLEEAERQGWRIEDGRSAHHKAYAPSGEGNRDATLNPRRQPRPLRRADAPNGLCLEGTLTWNTSSPSR